MNEKTIIVSGLDNVLKITEALISSGYKVSIKPLNDSDDYTTRTSLALFINPKFEISFNK